jgi:hypothetical protein
LGYSIQLRAPIQEIDSPFDAVADFNNDYCPTALAQGTSNTVRFRSSATDLQSSVGFEGSAYWTLGFVRWVSYVLEINGRHEETRTPDLYRVNFEVTTLKPFSSLAFPFLTTLENDWKQPSFGDELVTSF